MLRFLFAKTEKNNIYIFDIYTRRVEVLVYIYIYNIFILFYFRKKTVFQDLGRSTGYIL